MPYAFLRGLSMFYKEVGQGPALILVPGLGGDSRAFNPLLPFMRKHRVRLVAPDPRGLGRSGGSTEDLGLDEMALDLVSLMDCLGIEAAAFLGVSLGALVVRSLAAKWPQKVSRIVLCSPPPPAASQGEEWRERLRELLSRTPLEEIMMRLLEMMVAPRYLEANRSTLQELASRYQIDERTRRVMIRQLELWRGAGQQWSALEVPSLILGGDQDVLAGPEVLKRISRSVQGSRLVIFEGVGHHLVLEAPCLVARELGRFLAP